MNTSSYKNRGVEFTTVYEGMGKGKLKTPSGEAILLT